MTSKQTILVVDDTPENLAVIGGLLQPDYRVRVANSGKRALEMVDADPNLSLILLDVMMPDLDGYDVLERLRAQPACRDIPVIFITALDAQEDEERGFKLGAVDYIAKPIKPAIVQARVRAHLELKQARDLLKDQNAHLEAEVARRLSQNQLIQDVSILALASLAEMRDAETGQHLRRTQAYVRILANQLKSHPRFAAMLTDRTVESLAKSAPLHDIGKVGIPDHILLKPGKLTEEERKIVQTHARLGAEAIEQAEQEAEEPVEFLILAKEIARWHHERWDGGGYPDGLVGEAIPVSARIMALADVFDATVTPRVYRARLSFDQARRIIADGRGTQFDPDMVDAFLEHFDDFTAVAQRYLDRA